MFWLFELLLIDSFTSVRIQSTKKSSLGILESLAFCISLSMDSLKSASSCSLVIGVVSPDFV